MIRSVFGYGLLVTSALSSSGSVAGGRMAIGDQIVFPGIVSTPAAEVRIAFRPDGRQIVWGSIGRGSDPAQQDIWEMHRTQTGWSRPKRASFDTDTVEFDPAFSRDSTRLYFDSDRAGGYGGTDVYVVDVYVKTGAFSAPRNLGPSINSKGDEWAPTPTRSGTILFSSDGWGGFGKHDLLEGDPRTTTPPRNLGSGINGPDEDFDAALSPNEMSLVFSSGSMTDTVADVHLFEAKRQGSGWRSRQPLRIGCSDFQIGSAFAANQPRTLYYSARCAGGLGRMDIRSVDLPKFSTR